VHPVKSIKERLPRIDEILNKAEEELLKEHNVENLSELVKELGISKLVVSLERKADIIYRLKEREALKEYLKDKGLRDEDAEKVTNLILQERDLTKEISNIRRARAGITAEKIVIKALRAFEIPCQRGKIKIRGYRPDIVVPNNHVLKKDPKKGVAIAVKRTLRERWAEDIAVFTFPNGKFVLLTPDPDFNEEKAKDMISRGMREVYIPDELYEQSPFVKKYPEFKKLSQLPSDIKGVIERN